VRITNISARNHTIPLMESFDDSRSRLHSLPYAFLELETVEEISGIGEAATLWNITGETQESVQGMLKHIYPLIVNKECHHIEDVKSLMAELHTVISGNNALKCAIDSALIDALGKELRQPVWEMFSPETHSGIIGSSTVIPVISDITQARTVIKMALSRGASRLKLKGSPHISYDIAIL